MRLWDDHQTGYVAAWRAIGERLKGDPDIKPPRVLWAKRDAEKVTLQARAK